MATAITSAVDDAPRKTAAAALQGALTDLLDLSLQGKQAHWTVVGPEFRPLHEQLDEIVDLARGFADDAAERAVALGAIPDGRAATVAADSPLAQPAAGYLPAAAALDHLIGVFAELTARMHARIRETEAEPVTQDLLIAITAGLEKQAWMLQAQRLG